MTFIRMRLEARAAVAATVGALVLASAAAGGAPGKWSSARERTGHRRRRAGARAREDAGRRSPRRLEREHRRVSRGHPHSSDHRNGRASGPGDDGRREPAASFPIPRSSRPTAACVSSSPPEPDRRSRVLPAPRDRSPVDPGRFRRESSRRGRRQGRPAWRRRPTAPRSRRGPARRSRFTAGSTVRRRRCSPLPAAARTHARTSPPIRPGPGVGGLVPLRGLRRAGNDCSANRLLYGRADGASDPAPGLESRSTRGSRTRRVCWTPQ